MDRAAVGLPVWPRALADLITSSGDKLLGGRAHPRRADGLPYLSVRVDTWLVRGSGAPNVV